MNERAAQTHAAGQGLFGPATRSFGIYYDDTFEDHPSFFTKRMFGGLAAYLFGRQMMVLVEPTRTGRWKWHGGSLRR